MNLATNARDAMPDGGTLTLSAAAESVTADQEHPASLAPGDYIRVTATDTGIGMDAATLAHATEPFFTTKPVNKGTGLGLAMTRGFAQQSGGGLMIASTPGRGTAVTLWLPQAGEPALGCLRRAAAPRTCLARSGSPRPSPASCSWTTSRWSAACSPQRWRNRATTLSRQRAAPPP